jgi:predicted oxidoreductase (fatty acid repression mutant protein)
MISKTRKTKKLGKYSRKNPESEVVNLFNDLIREKDKVKKRRLAQTLKRELSEDSARYWQIIRTHVNFTKNEINEIINRALIMSSAKTGIKVKNPVKGIFRDTEVVVKHKGNKIVFDEEDADVIKNLIRKQYSDNDDVKEILK